MPVIVHIQDPTLFLNDDSPFHEILARHGIQKGDYDVLRPMPPMLLFNELNDDIIGELEMFPVQVERGDDD